ncbi:tigger transposable element-derived protein 2-like [Toxorhynchites rutilus septentrionalis]|uniref:tigger transposable element-derived protein 2-like n=1 Tax=Toxorhynchites rutilus septentrionalis TaxID=329112 RepID=UPI00247A36A7|nr:tigger transposable element-derived protein 2-like [Toxorhynchites rutilus septentrionalis]
MGPKIQKYFSGEKSKRSVVLLIDKVKILKDADQGMSINSIMRKYNRKSRSTVSTIKRAKENILSQIAEVQGNISNRKRFKKAQHPEVDEALYIWFLQKREGNVPVNHEMLEVQAQKFYSQMVGEGQYGSRGYVDKFIKRYGIRLLKITGEKLFSNIGIIDKYVEEFSMEMRSLNLKPYQIFNADESGLYFKSHFNDDVC